MILGQLKSCILLKEPNKVKSLFFFHLYCTFSKVCSTFDSENAPFSQTNILLRLYLLVEFKTGSAKTEEVSVM